MTTRIPLEKPLTAGQLRIADLLAQGYSVPEIARIVNRHPSTVEWNIYRAAKLIPGDLHQTARVTAWARGASMEVLVGTSNPLARALAIHGI